MLNASAWGTSSADHSEKRRVTASIVAGILVGLVTGAAASSFMMAAWSSIHGGLSGMTLAVLSVVALAVPPGCGFLAGRAMYRWWPPRMAIEIDDFSSPTSGGQHATSARSTDLTCPYCGCFLERPAGYAARPPYTVVECPIHGPFHLGPGTPLTLGRPPEL